MAGRPPDFKFPPGLRRGLRVVANEKHDAAHRGTPKRRKGTITAPTSMPMTVRVHWDGCVRPREVDCRFFNVIEGSEQ